MGLKNDEMTICKIKIFYTINNSQGPMSPPEPAILLQQVLNSPTQLKHKLKTNFMKMIEVIKEKMNKIP